MALSPISFSAFCSLAIFFTGQNADATCIKVPQQVIVPPVHGAPSKSFCIQQATLLRPASMRVFVNGSCLMFDACRDTDTSNETLPLYKPLGGPFARQLLLRCHAKSNCDPYDFLTSGIANTVPLNEESMAGNTDSYKSPYTTKDPSPYSNVQMVMMDDHAVIKVNLTFSMPSTGSILGGKWFSKENLAAAMPWDVNDMKSRSYEIFSMVGVSGFNARFFTRTTGKRCDDIAGYTLVVPTSGCSWITSPNTKAYLWTGSGPAIFKIGHTMATEFRIYGTEIPTDETFYIKV